MCVAIAIPEGERITRSAFDNGWDRNPDGGGLAYIHPKGHIVTKHSLVRKELWRMYQKATKEAPDSPMILHMRVATHGSIRIENCHPFRVENGSKYDTVFAHNGIIGQVRNDISDKADESDTRAFGRLFLDVLPPLWFDNPAMFDLVEDYLGYSNKIVVLTTEKHAEHRMYVLNKFLGESDDNGVWYSNGSCFPRKHKWPKGRPVYDSRTDEEYDLGWLSEYDGKKDPKGVYSGKARDTVLAEVISSHSGGDEAQLQAAIDAAEMSEGEVYFPFGANYAIGSLDTEWAATVWSEAIDLGYCEVCCHRPCNCAMVCHDCTQGFSDCDCEEGPLNITNQDLELHPITDWGEWGIPGRRRPTPYEMTRDGEGLSFRRFHEMTDEEWLKVEDAII